MAIKLSNGTQLNTTGQQDANGHPIYSDTTGNLYTSQNGQWILSRQANQLDQDIFKYLGDIGQTDLSPILGNTRKAISDAYGQYQSAFTVPSLDSFRGQSESDIHSFFDKDFDILNRQVALAQQQEKQKKDTLSTRLGEDQTSYFQIEDKDFARALQGAQSGYAGKNTFTSGFRTKAIDQKVLDRETSLGLKKTEFARTGQDINTDFTNFMDTSNLDKEAKTLALQRQQEQAIIARQTQLKDEAVNQSLAKQQGALDFIRQKLG